MSRVDEKAPTAAYPLRVLGRVLRADANIAQKSGPDLRQLPALAIDDRRLLDSLQDEPHNLLQDLPSGKYLLEAVRHHCEPYLMACCQY